MLVLVDVCRQPSPPHLSDGPLCVGPKVLGCVVSVIPLASLLDAEDAAEGTIGDLVLPLVLSNYNLHYRSSSPEGRYSGHIFSTLIQGLV